MRKATLCIFMVSVLLTAVRAGSTSIEEGEKEWDDFESMKATHHPWRRDMALPSDPAGAGLRGSVKRCALMPVNRDGGSTGGFVRDADGNYLAFAIALPVSDWDDTFNPRPRFYLGATWWHDPHAVSVPYDSPCERMLIGFLGDSWQSIESEHMAIIEQIQKRCLEDPAPNKDLLLKCESALEDYRKIKAAEPGATDNPDDAQRLREDH